MMGRIWRAMLAAASVRFWAMVGASIMLTVTAWLVVGIITWHWAPIVETGRRIDILGKALWIVLAGIIIIVIALTGKRVDAGGVWGHLNVQDGEDEADKPPATVTITTTKTETKP